jgi:hypothetical protein
MHLADPESVHGQLQRGRGAGFRRALTEPGAAEVVYDCVRRDPRWDRQTESRDGYLVRLVQRLALPVEPIAGYLFDSDDDDPWSIGLAAGVLIGLARQSDGPALAALHRYVAAGRHWSWVLDALWASGDPRLWDGLAGLVLARLDDQELAGTVDPDWGPWTDWSPTQPRIQAALAGRPAARVAERPSLAGVDRASLLSQARSGADLPTRRRAVIELGRRGDLTVLDLAEEPGNLPGLGPALRALGELVVPRARSWVSGGGDFLADHGIDVLAAHGDDSDVEVLLAWLDAAVQEDDWCAVEPLARGLGRLRVAVAAPVLLAAWRDTPHSCARADLLTGLCGAAPEAARPLLDEGLDDCEPEVRRIAGYSLK